MTAEIAVLNTQGVALAADSAVTITTPRGSKIYNTANKLFRLSNTEPVGVMVHNAASYMQVPWETLIKEYRRLFGNVSYSTLVEYADDFVDYLGKADLPEVGVDAVIHELAYAMHFAETQLDAWAKQLFDENPNTRVSEQAAADKLLEIVESIHELQQQGGLFEGIRSNTAFPSLRTASFKRQVESLAVESFSTSLVSNMLVSVLVDLSHEIARRGNVRGEESGVVVAGFGSDELFPQLCSFEIRASLDGKMRHRPMKIHQVDARNSATVIPFAQSDVIQTFMDGINPRLAEYFGNEVVKLMNQVVDTVLQTRPDGDTDETPKIYERVEESTAKCVEELTKKVRTWQKDHVSGPVVRAVSHLPLDELATMAESLITMTALRRRVSMDPETVGGAIDVAVISKGDGFVWMNRKHYFTPSLNYHFFDRSRAIAEEHTSE